jgi:hypothetical protein
MATTSMQAERIPVRLPLLIIGSVCALSLARCSHDSNTLTVSPPLPPAEEPSDDTPGAYAADAGANTPAGADTQKEKKAEEAPDPQEGKDTP